MIGRQVWTMPNGVPRYLPDSLSRTAALEELLTDVTGLIASHGMLLVATVVHQTPSIAPFDYLLAVMRAVALVLLTSAALR